MQYMGSKNKLAKRLLPIILEGNKDKPWVEPFVGGANMIDKVPNTTRIGADTNSYLIAMWQALQAGWIPPFSLTREAYKEIQTNKNAHPAELVAFVGFLCSFGGKWFGGYAANSKGENYAARGARCLLKQLPSIQSVDFVNCSYDTLVIPENSVIYCDPPYAGTTKYKDTFDHDSFWSWVRGLSNEHSVWVSEYTAPDDFEAVLTIEHTTILNKNKHDIRIEKLYRLRS